MMYFTYYTLSSVEIQTLGMAVLWTQRAFVYVCPYPCGVHDLRRTLRQGTTAHDESVGHS